MQVGPLIQDLALILAIASFVVLFFHRIKQPVVLGYIVAGMIVSGLSHSENISTLAELGVLFLMFSLGLEFSFRKLAQIGGQVAFMGLFETSFMFAGGWALGQGFGFSSLERLFLGAMVAISSTTVIAKAFDECGLKSRKFAQTVMGILIVEDLLAILLLVALGTLGTSETLSPKLIAQTLGTLVLVVGGWFLVGYFALPRLMKIVGNTRSDEILVITSIGLCLALGVIGTRYHFSPALGAFIMGSILAESTVSHRISELVRPLRDLFVAIFFVSVGMMIQPRAILDAPKLIFVLVAWVIVGKLIAGTLASLMVGKSLRNSVQTGASLVQIGEFSFILTTVGIASGALTPSLQPVIVAVAILTTLSTPYFIRHSNSLAEALEKRIPQTILIRIDHYSRWRESLVNQVSPRMHLRAPFTRWLIAGLVVVLGSQLGRDQLIPLLVRIDEIPLAYIPQIAGFLTAIAVIPFLWRFLRGIPIATPPTPSLRIVEVSTQLLSLLITGILGLPFFEGTPIVLFISLAAIITALRLVRPIGAIYEWFERNFISSFSHSTATSQPQWTQTLAPWEHHLVSLVLHPDSDFSGKTLMAAALRKNHGITVVAIQRGSQLLIAPHPEQQIFPFDTLLVLGLENQIERVRPQIELQNSTLHAPPRLEGYELRSVHVPAGAFCVGKTLREADFRGKMGGLVTGIERQGVRILNPDSELRIQPGDNLWMVGESRRLSEAFESPQAK